MIRPISVLLAAALLLGPVLAVELVARALVDAGRLPLAPSSIEEADVSLGNLLRLGKPDVLVVGTSSIRAGLDPDVLEELVEEDLGRPVHIQNVAQAGITLEAQRLLVSELARRDLLPEVVVLAVTPVSLSGVHGHERDWFIESELGRLWGGCGDDPTRERWLECQLGRVSALWRWRGEPDRLAAAISTGMPTQLVAENGRTLHESGWLSTRYMPKGRVDRLIEQSIARVGEQIEVPDHVADGFASVVDELRAHGTEIVALRVPYWGELIDALVGINPDWEQELEDGYAKLEGAAGIELIDTGGFGDWVERTSLRDPRHLSREGAGPFTEQLWETSAFRQPILEVLATADPGS